MGLKDEFLVYLLVAMFNRPVRIVLGAITHDAPANPRQLGGDGADNYAELLSGGFELAHPEAQVPFELLGPDVERVGALYQAPAQEARSALADVQQSISAPRRILSRHQADGSCRLTAVAEAMRVAEVAL